MKSILFLLFGNVPILTEEFKAKFNKALCGC
jgi:hypothetical protein